MKNRVAALTFKTNVNFKSCIGLEMAAQTGHILTKFDGQAIFSYL